MVGTYPILLGTEEVGQAEVISKGLYYQFDCRCRIASEVIHRIVVQTGEKKENLGILMPEGDAFSLRTKIPKSHFSVEEPVFRMIPKHSPLDKNWLPLSPEEPFSYIQDLKRAYLVKQGERKFLAFREEVKEEPTPQDNDPNP